MRIQVEDFFNMYTRLRIPSTLPVITDYQIFKSGIRPVWEDECNIKGGKWIMRLKKGIIDKFWEDLILEMIGDNLLTNTDNICGAVVSVRAAEDILSVWIRKSDEDVINKVKDELKLLLNLPPSFEMQFKSNSG